PATQAWSGLGSLLDRAARQLLPVSGYDPISDLFLEYGGLRGEGGLASDSLWVFDLNAQRWAYLGRGRPVSDAAGAFCPCTGELFVATGQESTATFLAGLHADAYFLRIEQPAQFEWDGAAAQRNAPWRWGTLTLEQDGEIQPGSVRLMNCA